MSNKLVHCDPIEVHLALQYIYLFKSDIPVIVHCPFCKMPTITEPIGASYRCNNCCEFLFVNELVRTPTDTYIEIIKGLPLSSMELDGKDVEGKSYKDLSIDQIADLDLQCSDLYLNDY